MHMGNIGNVASMYALHRKEQRHHAEHPNEEPDEEPRVDFEFPFHDRVIPSRWLS